MSELLRVLIVDDEPLARERAARLLSKIGGCEIVGQAINGRQALQMIESHEPDVVLLDIQMPDLDGLRVMEALDDPPAVIFSTAYEHHAVKAFDLNAVDYLLKPYSAERLGRALQRVRDRLQADLRAAPKPEARVSALEGRATVLVEMRRIVKFCIENGIVFLHRDDGERLICEQPLQELEQQVEGAMFMRINRQCIANVERIESFAPNGDGGLTITMSDGSTEQVSRRRARFLREALRR